jgi:DNA helicase-2/ATP-dependent DNA helicase PcrA
MDDSRFAPDPDDTPAASYPEELADLLPDAKPGVNIAALLDGLNTQQRAAVCHTGSHLLVVAGPGSGKTKVLTTRIARLISDGVQPRRICAVTFTNKAAGEMRRRLTTLLGDDVWSMWTGTFHSVCVRILRAEHVAAGLPASFSICDVADSQRLVRRAIVAAGAVEGDDRKEVEAEAQQLARTYRDAISRLKNQGIRPNADVISELPAFLPVWAAYQDLLRDSGAVDFDDLLCLVRDLLLDPDVLARWASRFDHLLVDEYQDTNPLQDQIVASLASASTIVCAVGDLDQAIFRFRGADPEGINQFESRFRGAEVIRLVQNYRSTMGVLAVCDAIIAPNPGLHRAPLWSERGPGDLPKLMTFGSDRAEAEWIVKQIKQARRPWSDTAILLRTAATSRLFEEQLRRSQIPHRVIGGMKFYERAEIRDVVSWVRFALNPTDRLAFERAAGTVSGVGDKTIDAVIAAAEDGNYVAASREVAGSGNSKRALALHDFADAADAVSAAAAHGPVAAVGAAVARVGAAQRWAKAADAVDREANLAELLSEVTDWAATTKVTVDGSDMSSLSGVEKTVAWCEHATLDAGEQKDEGAAVELITVHSAKGREYPVVFVPAVEERLFPHAKAIDDPADVREERRLLFVACSRAEDELVISWARRRMVAGFLDENRQLSRFCRDIDHLVRADEWPAPGSAEHSRTMDGRRRDHSSWGSRGSYTPQRPTPQRHSTPAPVPTPPPSSRWERGTAVEHPQFGLGVVVVALAGQATVRFSGGTHRVTDGSLRAAPEATPASALPAAPQRATFDPGVPDWLQPGVDVSHPTFGTGTVLRLAGDTVDVVFDGRRRSLDARFAPLAPHRP